MAGPIGFGVDKALRERRDRRRRRPARPPGPGASWMYFVLLTASMSWMAAALVMEPRGGLLQASLWYAAVMGWQPLVAAAVVHWARGNDTDTAVRAAPLGELLMAIAIAMGCTAAAAVLAVATGDVVHVPGNPEAAGAALAAFGILWFQAITEEYGWRGAPLAWAIKRWGARGGVVVHGIAWGLSYAPLFVQSGAFDVVVTLSILGIVLAWLRLRSSSLVPAIVANTVLTVAAGLPLVLHDEATTARDAVFRWPGLPVLGLLAIFVLGWRRADLEH
jgi:membrane protease YdiL (CAAX protease family)